MDKTSVNHEQQAPIVEGKTATVGEARRWVFEVEHRGVKVRGSYQDELGNNIEIWRGGELWKAFTYPGYRIWNIAAHHYEYVERLMAQENALWRTAFISTTNSLSRAHDDQYGYWDEAQPEVETQTEEG